MMIPEWILWTIGVLVGLPFLSVILFFAFIGILVLKNF